MKRKSRLLPMSLTFADRSPLLNAVCFTWRSDGVSFRCFGVAVHGRDDFREHSFLSFFCFVVAKKQGCLYRRTLLPSRYQLIRIHSLLKLGVLSVAHPLESVRVPYVFEVFLNLRTWMVSKI